jgi:hypothetical protein
MSESPNPIRVTVDEKVDVNRALLPGGWPFLWGALRTVDPLYIWSGVFGLVAAPVLIAVVQLMRSARLQ